MPSSRSVSCAWSVGHFLDRLASSDPAPGGGSASALAGALGCSLGLMVGGILLSRPRIPPVEKKRLKKSMSDLQRTAGRFRSLMKEDAQAYEKLVRAQKSGRGLRQARRNALACPERICEESKRAAALLRAIGKKTGPYLGSDVQAGIALLQGAFQASYAMVEVNRK